MLTYFKDNSCVLKKKKPKKAGWASPNIQKMAFLGESEVKNYYFSYILS